jgi:NADPH:quinone reductase-like Zn-dependent oxidoreductase
MRTFQLSKAGAGIAGLSKVDRPMPKPGHRQVLVKVAACSLNYRDIGIVHGRYSQWSGENIIPLSDGAGEVIEIGQNVQRVKVGDRVCGCFFQRWSGGQPSSLTPASALGGAIDGMLAEYVVLEEDGVVKAPEHLSLQEAATLPCAAVTAWHAMVEHAKLIAGQSVLLLGTGGVSIFGLQLAKAMGLEIVITSSSDEKLARAKQMGAHHGINYKTTPDWEKAAVKLTNGGVDAVVEVGGPGTFGRSLAAIRPGGKVSMIGSLSAVVDISPNAIRARRANVQAISVGSTEMFEAMNRAISVNKIKPVIDKVLPFDDTPAAYRHLESATHFGKVVISVA